MDKPIKRLPNGAPSALSMNSFLITGIEKEDPLSRWNGKHGTDVYSGAKIDALLADILLRHTVHTKDPINSILQQESIDAQRIRLCLSYIAGGLSCIFYLLNTNHPTCRQANCLNEYDWEFWSKAKRVFLVGRLVEGQAGAYIESEITRQLVRLGTQTLRVSCFENSVTPSLIGCASSSYPLEPIFVFDFGASMAKSGIAHNGRNGYQIEELSQQKTPQIKNATHSKEDAELLHRYILNVILSTVEKQAYQKPIRTISVSMCIANNIFDGKISDRGFFAPLRRLAPSYFQYLKNDLEHCFHCPVALSIQNDAEAVTHLFTEYAPYAAAITLGTAMGIAYPKAKGKFYNR